MKGLEKGSPSSVWLFLTILGGATALAVAVWYPTSELVRELTKLVQVLEKTAQETASTQRTTPGPVDKDTPLLPKDCYDVMEGGAVGSGVYTIFPGGLKQGLQVYCDLDTDGGGWMVFVRRFNGEMDFKKNWESYQMGFGDIMGEHWLGNEFVHLVTSQGLYELRVDMADFEGDQRYAKYKLFQVDGRKTKYELTVAGFFGDTGDSMKDHSGFPFSTFDQDNDGAPGNCAASFKGGFWYHNCHTAHPTGLYLKGEHDSLADGIHWYHWKGYKYSLKHVEFKIRPL